MKRILYFFAGTAIGAGVTYFITKSIFNENFLSNLMRFISTMKKNSESARRL